LEMKKSP